MGLSLATGQGPQATCGPGNAHLDGEEEKVLAGWGWAPPAAPCGIAPGWAAPQCLPGSRGPSVGLSVGSNSNTITVKRAGLCDKFILSVNRNWQLISRVALLFYILANNVGVVQLHATSPAWSHHDFQFSTLIGMECYLIVISICIFLIANDFEHLFMCFSAIYLL